MAVDKCSRSLPITFTFCVTKQHPDDISFLKKVSGIPLNFENKDLFYCYLKPHFGTLENKNKFLYQY